MAEWLRRLTRNQIPSGSAGSSPADCETDFFPFILIYNHFLFFIIIQFRSFLENFVIVRFAVCSEIKKIYQYFLHKFLLRKTSLHFLRQKGTQDKKYSQEKGKSDLPHRELNPGLLGESQVS